MDHSAERFMINSFVFLDFETSHLYKCDRPKIIEISLFAVHRTALLHPDVLTSISRARRGHATYDLSKVSFPRVVDKLTLCLDPKKHTSAETFGLSKLDNLNLCESKKMSLDEDVITMLNIFMSRQEAPVCVVAHNGNGFDFPILRTEVSQVTDVEQFQDLYCADSLEGFRDNFATEADAKEDTETVSLKRKLPDFDHSKAWACPEKRGTNLSETMTSADCNTMVSSTGDVTATVVTGAAEASANCSVVSTSNPHTFSSTSIQPQSSEDPSVCARPSVVSQDAVSFHTSSKDNSRNSSENTPERSVTKRPSPPPPPRKTNQPCQSESKSKTISYRLPDIFQRTFGREPPNSHSAEDDVASLIKVLLPRVEEFVNWAEIHATQYKDVGLFYKPKPLKSKRRLNFDD